MTSPGGPVDEKIDASKDAADDTDLITEAPLEADSESSTNAASEVDQLVKNIEIQTYSESEDNDEDPEIVSTFANSKKSVYILDQPQQLILPSPPPSKGPSRSEIYLDYPLKCPIITCQSFLRIYNFYEHMCECHDGLNVGEATVDEQLNIQIFLNERQNDEPFCHGFFTLRLPLRESGPAWKQRIPILLMSRVVDLRELGFNSWKGQPISELYFMVWFIGIQCTGLPPLQVEMDTEMFGMKVATLRCAQKPQDIVNLLVTHAAIFFTKDDMIKFSNQPSPYMQVRLKVSSREDFIGFDISRVKL